MLLYLVYTNGRSYLLITSHSLILLIFIKTKSVNLAVEKRVINVITIFENPSGNANHDKSITEEPLSSANPSNKLKIKEKNLIIKAASSIDAYLSTTSPTDITS